MKRRRRWSGDTWPVCYGLALALAFAAPLASAELPQPFEADYEASQFPFSAKARIGLARTGNYYRFIIKASVYTAGYKWGESSDCSVLQVRGGELYPLEYRHRDQRARRFDVSTRFDWTARTIRTVVGERVPRQLDGAVYPVWDWSSVQVRLLADVASMTSGAAREYPVLEKGELARQQVVFDGHGTVEIDGESLEVVKLRATGSKGKGEFWYAQDYAWLPVRISINGVTLELVSAPVRARREIAPATSPAPACPQS